MGTKMSEDRYAFVVEHYDKFGDRVVIYHLLYYPNDQSVEILDPKNKRIFLKKTPYPEIQVKDLFLGTKLNVYARQYKIVEFGDEYTRNKLGKKQEKTLGIIVPDYSMGKVIALINKAGVIISKMKMIYITKEDANDFLAIGGRAFSGIKEGQIVVLELQGEDCTRKYREVVSKTDSLYGRGAIGKVAYCNTDNNNYINELEFFFDGHRQFQYPTTFNNCTLGVIKPHSVMSGSLGGIIDNILEEGFEISSMAMFYLDLATAEEFLEVYKGILPDFHSLVVELSSGGCVALEIRTENPVESFRKLVGPHDPELARMIRPETLRAKFGIDKVKNAVHCTDLNEDGPMEVEYFFNILLQ
eukprot:TRINITY_DN4822_c0_g1_i1.p1 TRINITY_DN4822_c0_g1~~TRINITY_DN4822_c0_g1_i1.p1  ORF type:complete len:384 (+),score=73.44 TRINITY_DN4822_c0_g1_i1:83-1153(+)